MGVAAAPVIAAMVVGGATTLYASSEQSRQARMARDQQKDMVKDQKKELAKREQEEKATAIRNSQRASKQAKAAMSGGKQSTILTSPLGIIGSSEERAKKSILGA